MAAATLLLRLGGFLRETALAYAYGASTVTDAFVIAYSLPNLILSFIVVATAETYITIHASLAPDNRNRFSSNLLTVFALISLIIAAAMLAAPQVFVRILASRAEQEMAGTAAMFLRYMSLATVPMTRAGSAQQHG